MRTATRARMLGTALAVALIAMAVGVPTAHALPRDCPRGCVLLIEVDGLEPGDVSRTDTPFLWALSHPNPVNQPDAAGQLAAGLFPGRNGFIWQAARAPMTAGTAPSAVSLLTGANPDTHGVPADEFVDPTLVPVSETDRRIRRLRAVNDQGGGAAKPIDRISARTSTLLELAADESIAPDPQVWTFIGNPALAAVFSEDAVTRSWSPTASTGSDPALCPLPRTVPVTVDSGAPQDTRATLERDCPARDATTLNQAFSTLSGGTKTPVLTYIHLAELGRIKQLGGESDAARTVAQLDAALAAFFEGLIRHPNTSGGWGKTIVIVTGNHGYEPTPTTQRVPHPDDDTRDFAEWVTARSDDEKAVFVGQGTIGTVYWPDATTEQLEALADDIEGACDCIDEVVPVASLATLHATWHVNPLTVDGLPTGVGGELLVTTEPGWAFGRVQPGTDESAEATNPYAASAGGPRNRAIAMLMNGPKTGLPHTIRQVEGDWMRVKPTAESPPACKSGGNMTLADANDPAKMADDAAAPGHECQPETVDVALTLAAMFNVSLGAQQAPQARFLNEAFTPPVGVEEDVEPEQEEIRPEEPPPPPPPIIIQRGSLQVITPPPPRDPFPYRGLIRRLRARVTDAKGRTFLQARRGARMSIIEVTADIGKPESLVTLTFYRRAKSRLSRGRLAAIARFKPFTVKRGPVRLRLRIPKQFRPTHLGVSVQELAEEGGVKRPVGRPGGGIAKISGAARLHSRKGTSRRSRRARR